MFDIYYGVLLIKYMVETSVGSVMVVGFLRVIVVGCLIGCCVCWLNVDDGFLWVV